MFNTYGLRSINVGTFNLKYHTNYSYPKEIRDTVITSLRVHNLLLNLLGYIKKTALFSGCARILSGSSIFLLTLCIGERDAEKGAIIGHWYDEALTMGVAQVARGAIEAFMPYGRIVNLSGDIIATIVNVFEEAGALSVCTGCLGFVNHEPYEDPDYPLPLRFLNFV